MKNVNLLKGVALAAFVLTYSFQTYAAAVAPVRVRKNPASASVNPEIPRPAASPKEGAILLEGIFGAISLSTYSGTVAVDFDAFTSDTNSETVALKVGYGRIKEKELGFIGALAVGQMVSGTGWKSYGYIRPEANATFAFTPIAYVLGGLNLNKYVAGGASKFDIGLGYQLGIGLNLDRLLMELRYVSMSNSFEDARLTLSGPEVSIGYKF